MVYVLLVAQMVKGKPFSPGKFNQYISKKKYRKEQIHPVILWALVKAKTLRGAISRYKMVYTKMQDAAVENLDIIDFSVVLYNTRKDEPVKASKEEDFNRGLLFPPTTKCTNKYLRKLNIIK